VWERIQKIAILKQLQTHFKGKCKKDVRTPFPHVPAPLHPWTRQYLFQTLFPESQTLCVENSINLTECLVEIVCYFSRKEKFEHGCVFLLLNVSPLN